MNAPRVGIDLMGGDQPPSVLLEAVACLLEQLKSSVHLTLFGTKEVLALVPPASLPIAISCVEAEEVIEMEDDPLTVVRTKRKASMPLGVIALQERKIDAIVTTGNTGALIACASLFLNPIGGIARPALLTLLPTKRSPMAVLDVGANISCTEDLLLQFAKMGIAFQKSRGMKNPRVGLLNIGREKRKGTLELRRAHKRFTEEFGPLFFGNIEGREAFFGEVDVLVTDGFTGNVFLKTAEGVSELVLERLEESLGQIVNDKMGHLKNELDHAEYPGALLCGVDGIVVKCHGNADPKALRNGVKKALELIEGKFLEKIKNQLA